MVALGTGATREPDFSGFGVQSDGVGSIGSTDWKLCDVGTFSPGPWKMVRAVGSGDSLMISLIKNGGVPAV